jgi:DNA polymerase-1
MNKPSRLVLIDGSSYLYRAFNALPPLKNRAGEPTGAVYGVLNMLLKLRREEESARFAVVMDAPGKTFRDDLFAEYKSHRPPMPEDLRAQIEPLIAAIKALGIPLLRINGVEADDVIGTLATTASAAGIDTLISTGDKDMAQLVSERILVVDTMSGRRFDAEGVREKFGVTPAQMVDYLALVGDTSDNIPGVPKVGPKTAAKWLQEYGSVDAIVANAKDIAGKVGESLRENLGALELSRKLATIDCALKLEVGPDDLRMAAPDLAALREIYSRLEFRSLLQSLPENDADQAAPAIAPARHYETVIERAQLDRWLTRISAAKLTALDTETTSLDYMEAELVGISLAVEPNEAAYIPVAHRYAGAPVQLDRDEVLACLKPWLEDDARAKVGHHLKYDAHVFANYGVRLRGLRFDSMLESYVLNSTATRHDMDSTARLYLGVETVTYEQVTGKGAKQIGFEQVAVDKATEYAAEDADITLQLHLTLWEKLQAVPGLSAVYQEIEQPLVPVLTRMEEHGVRVDEKLLKELSAEFAERMAETEAQAHRAAGHPFNLSSPKQLIEVLYTEKGLPVLGRTPSGAPSTAEEMLEELAVEHELPKLILAYRSLAKLKSTYTDKLPEQICKRTGRIHTSYHQAVAATGRLSSTDPNLQNIPIRTEAGRRIRQAFVASPGHMLVAADYSQIELRIMAHVSGDPGLLRAFAEDRDIHQATAAEVFGVGLDVVTADQRRSAKAINFGLIYGMSAFGLARQLGIPRDAAQGYVDLYFQRYPGVKRYMDETRRRARDEGFVSTVFGRRLYLPDIKAPQAARRQYAERSAINAPMQGTAADIIKKAMIAVDAWLQSDSVDGRLIMQVHDELVLEVVNKDVSAVCHQLSELMSGAAKLAVPLKVDVGSGANWDEAH